MRIPDRWQDGASYERYVGRWSALVADRFVDELGAARGIRWLDVGCGTGALTEAIVERCDPASVIGVDPSPGFLAAARARPRLAGLPAVRFEEGDAMRLPAADGSADVVVSGLVLNFVPDPAAALAEFRRVVAPDGIIGSYVWDYADGMQLMRLFWDAAGAVDPLAVALDEGRRFPLCRPEALLEALTSALGGEASSVRVWPIEIATVFADFDDLWTPFLGGQGPAPAYLATVTDGAREAIRERVRASAPTGADGSIALTARAWAVAGREPG
jgi:SAM-dependent methyltransferase